MKLKVCGMTELGNIQQLEQLQPDWMGLIFYPASPRFPENLKPVEIQAVDIKKVGVFVNESVDQILQTVSDWKLDLVQLHGDESVQQVKQLYNAGVKLIKVFRVKDRLPDDLTSYAPYVEMFLFDTLKSSAYGGTGEKFDWNLLKGYHLNLPYLLSGGVGPEDIAMIRQLQLPGMIGIDLNSKVELSPGIKDIEKINMIKEKL